jgi:hypothetical protein
MEFGFFLDTIKPWFLTEGKFASVLIIPSSWGSQLGGYLPASGDSLFPHEGASDIPWHRVGVLTLIHADMPL